MKKLSLFLCFLASSSIFSQTNTFPASGNVGIGTSSPSSKLYVKGETIIESHDSKIILAAGKKNADGKINFTWHRDINSGGFGVSYLVRDQNGTNRQVASHSNTGSGVAIYNENGSEIYKINEGDLGNNKVFMHFPKSDSRIVIGSYGSYLSDQGHKFVVKNGSAMIENAIYTNGEIGIGTTDTQGYKLAVAGKIISEEVKVKLQSSWPDYVFDSTYSLPSLQQVENHILEKGHLINIPSAKEVTQNGIQLGEMNAKLLEKIEELTLYTIAQEKQLKTQEKRIKEQEVINNKLASKNKDLENRLKRIENLLDRK